MAMLPNNGLFGGNFIYFGPVRSARHALRAYQLRNFARRTQNMQYYK
jgi:hypothetical protein